MPIRFAEDPAESMNVFEAGGTGVLAGLRRDPLLRPPIDFVAHQMGVPQEALDELESRIEGSTPGQIGAFVGEFGPMFAGALGAFNIGRKLGTVALRNAPTLAKALGTTAAGSLGEGAFFGARELAESGEPKEAISAALDATKWSLGGQAVFAGVGRALGGPEITSSLRTMMAERHALSGGKRIMRDINSISSKMSDRVSKINKVLGVSAQESEMLDPDKFIDVLDRANLVDAATRSLSKQRTRTLQSGKLITEGPFAGGMRRQGIVRRGGPPGQQEVFEEGERLLQTVDKQVRELRRLGVVRESLSKNMLRADPANAYVGTRPYDPQDGWLTLALGRLGMTSTPSGMARRGGVIGNNLDTLVQKTEGDAEAARLFTERKLTQFRSQVAKALGLKDLFGKPSGAGRKLAGTHWNPLFNAWRRTGEEGVRAVMAKQGRSPQEANEVIQVFGEIDDWLTQSYEPLVRLGGEAALNPAEIQKAGHSKYLPTMFKNVDKKIIYEKIAEVLGEDKANTIMRKIRHGGISEMGSRALWRQISALEPEELAALQRQGIFEDDPWSALYRELSDSARRAIYGKSFGYLDADRLRMREALVAAAREEARAAGSPGSGSATLIGNIFDAVTQKKYYEGGMKRMSDIMLSSSIASKMTFGSIPNSSQSINTGLMFGFRNLLRGAATAIREQKGGGDRALMEATGIVQQLIGNSIGREFTEEALENAQTGIRSLDLVGNAADRLASGVLRYSGFSLIERWNRIISAQTGLLYMRKQAIAKAQGLLRGEHHAQAERVLRRMGVDLDEYTQLARSATLDNGAAQRLQEIEVRAMRRAAQETQFTPSQSRKPTLWTTPWGRVMAQFKNFALGQAKFLRDQVFIEAARGNMRHAAYWLAMYPIAGEMVGDTRKFFQGKDPDEGSGIGNVLRGDTSQNGMLRLLEDYIAVGGLGLATDALTAARFGRGMEFLMGPSISDAVGLSEEFLTGDSAGVLSFAERQPLVKATQGVLGAANLTADAIAGYAADHFETQEPISLDEWRTEAAQRKR